MDAEGPQFTAVPSPLLKNIPKRIPTSWARSLDIYEKCSLLFLLTLHAIFRKHPKQETRLQTVQLLAKEIIRLHTLKRG